MQPSLDDTQRLAWLRLARSSRIGPVTFSNLINRFGSAQAALDALPEICARSGGTRPQICSEEKAEKELEDAAKYQIRHIACGEPDYPKPLRHIYDPPIFLLMKGKTAFENRPAIAIVGSRNASAVGQKITQYIATDLGDEGFIVVSGLARGIDTAAHKATLRSGTVAVMAGGLSRVYPPENENLFQEIISSGGAVMSEMPPTFRPRGQDFPRRNRIISGLSLATVVVEAAHRSGSLITARLAAEQNRQVFSVPGSPLDPRSEGTNDLIRQGAVLIRNAEDVISDLRPLLSQYDDRLPIENPGILNDTVNIDTSTDQTPFASHSSQEAIMKILSVTPVFIDDIIRITDLPTATVLSAVCDLEIAGHLTRHHGNKVSLSRVK